MKIKTGDTVVVISGGDQFTADKKGVKTRKSGRVLKVNRKDQTVFVEGINMVKKHQRPRSEQDKGGIIEIPAPIHISNIALVDPKLGVPTRVGYRFENGVKVRFAKKSGTTIDEVTSSKRKAEKKTTKAKKAKEGAES
jgi:large subunit ribosomal protein L24